MRYLLPSFALFLPGLASAQGLQTYIPSIITFINGAVIPFLLGIAFLIVVFNVVRYFIIESTNTDGREKAKGYILYSVFAFVFIVVFWGIINLLATATGLDNCRSPQSDYYLNTFVGPPLPDCL
jgi:hypothetical protein